MLSAVAFAALLGLGVAALGSGFALVLLFGLALGLVGLLTRFRFGERSGPLFPAATLLIAFGVVSSAWMGVQGPADVPLADLAILAAMPILAFAMLRGGSLLPLPGWLLCVAGGLAAAALLAALFVTNPPERILGEESALNLGAASTRSSDFALWARTEYAFVLLPLAVGMVACSWKRARVLADLWLVSATICAAVAVVDHLASTGIAASLVTTPVAEPGGRAFGLTIHPNYLGFFSAMTLPLGVTRIAQTTGPARLGPVAATATLALAVQLSGSRLALVTALVGLGALLFLVPVFRTRLVVAFSVCVAVAVGIFMIAPSEQSALERLSGSTDAAYANEKRFELIEEGLDVALDHPFTGVGFARILDSHSVPVQMLQSGGILALAALVLWVLGFLRVGVSLSRNPRVPTASAQLAAAMLAALAGWFLPGHPGSADCGAVHLRAGGHPSRVGARGCSRAEALPGSGGSSDRDPAHAVRRGVERTRGQGVEQLDRSQRRRGSPSEERADGARASTESRGSSARSARRDIRGAGSPAPRCRRAVEGRRASTRNARALRLPYPRLSRRRRGGGGRRVSSA